MQRVRREGRDSMEYFSTVESGFHGISIGNIAFILHLVLRLRDNPNRNYISKLPEATVTKADIIDQISDGTGLTKLETEAVVNGFMTVIKAELKKGGRIDLRGFGSFTVQHRAARTARNPRTNTPVPVPAAFIPAFKASKEFRKEVDEAMH